VERSKGRPECRICAVGAASGVGAGGFCPFVDRRHAAGELLYLEGEEARHIWYVKSGVVALLRRSKDDHGEGRVRAVRFPGSLIGLEALIAARYTDSARIASDAVLCGITREGADAWVGAPGTPARTALELTLRTAYADPARTAATDGSAVERVAAWLCDEGPRGMTLELPRHVIADLLGMRPETLSRVLTRLNDCGAIAATRTTLRIRDEQLLAQAAGRAADLL
jgi:CRP/FNR family transcriptional regulator, cyclic AMP receptor protein